MQKLLTALVLFLAAPAVHAQSNASNTLRNGLLVTGAEAGFGEENQSVYALIGGIINVVLGALGIVILLYLVWAGWIYATSGGEKEKIDKAKKMISSSIIGAVIVIASYALASYVLSAISTAVTAG
jgi:hypothetical protein